MNKNPKLWNILYLILAIVVAAGVWFYVDENSDRTVSVTVTDIPIEYTNQASLTDNGLMLVEGDRSKIRVTADLSSVTSAGVQSVNITTSYTDRKFNQSNTTIDKQSIYLATVNICELSHKEVELRCELTGNVAEGYSAGKVQLSQTARRTTLPLSAMPRWSLTWAKTPRKP